MDNAVALVRAYLQLNGYFTITEYPVVRRLHNGGFRTLTEIDIAAFHLPGGETDFEPDPALNVPRNKPDLIIGEVKEGRAVINEAATDPEVVAKILRRFGDSTASDARSSARTLLKNGAIDTRSGHRARLVAFGTMPSEVPGLISQCCCPTWWLTSIGTSPQTGSSFVRPDREIRFSA